MKSLTIKSKSKANMSTNSLNNTKDKVKKSKKISKSV